MIIIHPYRIASLVLTYDCVCKGLIDFNVMLPTLVLPRLESRVVGDLIVKSRPKNLFTISIIVTLQIGIRNKDWDRFLLRREVLGYI